MVVVKHLPPIQPYPVQHDAPVHIAPSDNGLGSDQAKRRQGGSRKGLVIRTSKHWVLPPRPKPGRKPSERRRTAPSATAGATAPAATTPAPVTIPAPASATSTLASAPTVPTSVPVSASTSSPSAAVPPSTPVSPGTSSIKKDLSKLPIKNINQSSKAHPSANTASASVSESGCNNNNRDYTNTDDQSANSLTPCVSPSPPKRTKTSLKREIQHIKSENTKLKQELGLLVGNLQDLKQKCRRVEAHEDSRNNDENVHCNRKRPLDESLAFLKFEEDEETLPPLLSSNKMKTSSSVSSRTNLTDDEDLLTASSSTPNSLFSLDLQHSHSSSSSCSRSHSKSSPSNEKSQLRFLDTFEQSEFNDKHAEKSMTAPAITATTSANPPTMAPSVELPLSSIKEEESDQFPWIDPAKEEASILDFLQTQQEIYTDPINDKDFFDNSITNNNGNDINDKNDEANGDDNYNNDVTNHNNNTENDDLFQNLSLAAPPTATTTTTACYVPPSLEELMEEQDGGFVNNSNANTTLTNVNDYDDDFDMLRTQVFDMA
ncbi:ZYRO0G03036p [Zygosaccharomyces rouxii]|uniref:ZYRO0G03036p n=1 Tax=Zygosaccharomyces rouxii (strain ATCC 2623 / CBS 732 / NBRC 1130 / NCYC 568 / NRRL Y-229) TaxID=559307 RepID=C5DZB6_ZYGRC|nr:uncharacterized protein ZYRO0G03036g [Zygosaccharomyces rouxii]KAH9202198.1 hypothetical protein LQ764DRAFT_3191 [Zygosaccharomyces rouxii]CAR29200.1 ZYRO0G03036p [Zygosaccharomyces rouxii]